MKRLIEDYSRKYDLELGDKVFSPIIKSSIGFSMDYYNLVKEGARVPFHINFPDKKDSAIWLSVVLLRNFLLLDYINQPTNKLDTLKCKVGDIIQIFGSGIRFEGVNGDKIKLSFLDQNTPIEISNKFIPYIKKTNKTKPNKFSHFIKSKNKIKKERNAISKLLEPNETIVISESVLSSKVLVVAGRGNIGRFNDRLKSNKVYNTPLSDVFNVGENIIIEPDLENYLSLTNTEDQNKEILFEKYFIKLSSQFNDNEFANSKELRKLVDSVLSKNYRNEEFISAFEHFIELVDGNEKFQSLFDRFYPGIRFELPKNLKFVIINDVNQIRSYPNVIQAFLDNNIPVLIISDKQVINAESLSLFSDSFDESNKDFKLNWNKKKINSLKVETTTSQKFVDGAFWEKCKRFSNQTIEIHSSGSPPLDKFITKAWRIIASLEGQEKLKEAYWRFYKPLFFSFKNSDGWKEYHNTLLGQFIQVFKKVESTLPSKLRDSISDLVKTLTESNISNKSLPENVNMFIQRIFLENYEITFPQGDFKEVYALSEARIKDNLTFPGYPMDEFHGRYISDSISEYMVEKIDIYCWINEGRFVYDYVKRILNAGYFLDNIFELPLLNESLLLTSEEDVIKEIDDSIIYKYTEKYQANTESTFDSNLQKTVSAFKYSQFTSSSATKDSKVKCNILELSHGEFILLPFNSTVLVKFDLNGKSVRVRRSKYDLIRVGDQIFQYNLDTHVLREISKQVDFRNNHFDKIRVWKDILKNLFESCYSDVSLVQVYLKALNVKHNIGGNPTYQNIRNWLFDSDMIAPEYNNLKMILAADSSNVGISQLDEVYNASKKIRAMSIRISAEIRKKIIERVKSLNMIENDDFTIEIYGRKIHVKFREIIGKQESDIEVDYQYTRKIFSL